MQSAQAQQVHAQQQQQQQQAAGSVGPGGPPLLPVLPDLPPYTSPAELATLTAQVGLKGFYVCQGQCSAGAKPGSHDTASAKKRSISAVHTLY